MSSKIAVLPDFVVNQIAAGEVLENPASAVKELVENSLDAGASEIRIEIEGGGLQRILIEDDGCGMSRADAILALKRHATSKIRSAEELERLITMGFRGEALAALASVSKLEMKTSDGNEATRVISSGGEILDVEVCARNRGSSIEARNLFFNAPARLKFQKSSGACAAAVLKVVENLSLSHANVRFQLFSNGKLTFEAKVKEWTARAEEVLGPFAHSVDYSEGRISIVGLLGRPEEGKGTRTGQTLFVNRRLIISPLIARAVKEGFGTRMVESLFPVFVLFVEVPSDLVDVNVHPQKKEVRFREEGRIFSTVRKAVASAFEEEMPAVAPMPWDFTAPKQSFFPEELPSFQCAETYLPLEIRGRAVAVMGDYLLVEERDWIWVDLKGAEARILYEAMEKSKPEMQTLIWPLEMQSEDAEEVAEHLKAVGIEARSIGKRGLAIDALPRGMKESLAIEFVRQYSAKRVLAAALSRTCRSRGRKFSLEEGAMIWEKLQGCKDKTYDPLGRKIMSVMAEDELAKRFE